MRLPISLSKHRPDTLSTFVLTMGIVDAVIGGVSGHGSLLILGLILMGGAVALRQPRVRTTRRGSARTRAPQRLLPEAARPALPLLMDPAKRS